MAAARYLCAALALSTLGACGASSGDAAHADSSVADAASPAPDLGPSADEAASFDQLLSDAQGILTKSGTPGASVAVVLHGRLAFAAGIGQRNVTTGDPVTTATLFRVASMSKMVLSATAMTLVDQGKLDLGAPITSYLPWFHLATGFDATQITMGTLLSHSSGFPCDTISQCGTSTSGSRKDFFSANPQPLWAPPGAIYDYSNTGFALAATVIEAAADANDGDYEMLARDRVLGPANMATATFDVGAAIAGDHATGYSLDANGNVTATLEPNDLACPLLNPPGGILATATDYAHFAEMILANGGSVLQPSSVVAMEASHADMHTFPTQAYGYGLTRQLSPYPDHASIWHNGSLPGFLSELWMIPDEQLAVVVLVNAQGTTAAADAIVSAALSRFVAEAKGEQPTTTPPAQWSGYAGTYDDNFGTLGAGIVVSLMMSGGTTSLLVDAPNATDYAGMPAPVTGAMKQQAIDSWGMPDGTAMTFFPGANGMSGYFATRRGVGIRR